MVPSASNAATYASGFPRASGDGPRARFWMEKFPKFPPRERGWSHHWRGEAAHRMVSPARAGMVPTLCNSHVAQSSFPRASGDGPRHSVNLVQLQQFPPRERGWSQNGCDSGCASAVSPARAGMVPRWVTGTRWVTGFPRASGDGPSSSEPPKHPASFPPRERGWSHAAGQLLGERRVSPARAGMVPSMDQEEVRLSRFPRASGDGPEELQAQKTAYAFPPRERGWSPRSPRNTC